MTDNNSAVNGASPLGKGSADEHPDALPRERAEVGKLSTGAGVPDAGHTKASANEEPEPALEPDLPTDGRDEVGEAMIRDLPKRELSDAPPEPADRH